MDQKLLDRLTRLRAMSEDVGSEAEAMIAMRRLHSLLAKHNLSLIDLDNQTAEGAIDQDSLVEINRPWKRQIINGVCKLYFCEMYMTRLDAKKAQFVITGQEHNRQFALFIINTVIRTVDAEAARQSRAVYGKRSTPFINSFRNGASSRIARRCFDMIVEASTGKLVDEESNTLPALADVYAAESRKIQEFLDKQNLNLETKKARAIKANDVLGFVKGQETGNSVQLSRAIHGKNSPKLLK